jgi:hypothetical protein
MDVVLLLYTLHKHCHNASSNLLPRIALDPFRKYHFCLISWQLRVVAFTLSKKMKTTELRDDFCETFGEIQSVPSEMYKVGRTHRYRDKTVISLRD